MEQARLKLLIDKYHNNRINSSELNELNNWFHSLNLAGTDLEMWIRQVGSKETLVNELFTDFKSRLEKAPKRRNIVPVKWMAAAASVILCIGVLYFIKSKPAAKSKLAIVRKDILPGSNKAILTLSNGSQIVLAGARNGNLATQGSVVIKKTADGKVVYENGSQSANTAIVYNTLTTPRGGQYSLTLIDGTKVWLNASSSIKYPSAYNGNERVVEITGEVYFEVVYNAAMPFKVISNGQTVEDLGTHFNINAYADEPMLKTTLLEGKIKVIKGGESILLKPGQQSQLVTNNSINVVNADTSEVIAWKNGLFRFHNASFQEVMRQLSRWYNVKVDYQGAIPNRKFSGEITRNVNISEVLDIMSFLKVHFSVKQDGQQSAITVINN